MIYYHDDRYFFFPHFLLYTFVTDHLAGLLQSTALPLSSSPVFGFSSSNVRLCVSFTKVFQLRSHPGKQGCSHPSSTWENALQLFSGILDLLTTYRGRSWPRCGVLDSWRMRKDRPFQTFSRHQNVMRSCTGTSHFLNVFRVEWDEIRYGCKRLCSKHTDLHLAFFLSLPCVHKKAAIFMGWKVRLQNQWAKVSKERRRKVDWFSNQTSCSKPGKGLLWKIFARIDYFDSL